MDSEKPDLKIISFQKKPGTTGTESVSFSPMYHDCFGGRQNYDWKVLFNHDDTKVRVQCANCTTQFDLEQLRELLKEER